MTVRSMPRTWRRLAILAAFVGIPTTLYLLSLRGRLLLREELPDHSVLEVVERRVPHGISGAFRYYATFDPPTDFQVVVDGLRTLRTGPWSDGSQVRGDWTKHQYIGGLHGWDSPGRKPSAVQMEGNRILLRSEEGTAAVLVRRSN